LFEKYRSEQIKEQPQGKSIENVMENTSNWGNYISMQQTKDNWRSRTSKFKKISLVRG
jgi:hypothetical protein